MEDNFSFFNIIVSILSGGIAGGVIQWIFTRSHRRDQVALDIFKDFLHIYFDIGEALDILKDGQKINEETNKNKVRKVADWMNLVALLCLENSVKKKILEQCGVQITMKRFHKFIDQSETKFGAFHNPWTSWRHLNSFCNQIRSE